MTTDAGDEPPTFLGETNQEADGLEVPCPEQDAGGNGSVKLPNVRIPRFNGDKKKYLDWEKEAQITQKIYQIAKDNMAGLVYLALAPSEGRPTGFFEYVDEDQISTEDIYDDLWKLLDQE